MPYYAPKKSAYTKKKRYARRPRQTVTPALVTKMIRKAEPTKEMRYEFYNTNFKTTAPISDSFSLTELTNITQGPQENQRIGDSIYLCGVKLKFTCNNPSTTPRNLRVMVLANRNANGDLLDTTTWTDLFTQTDETDRTADALNGDIVANINANYKIFMDRQYRLDASNLDVVSKQMYVPLGHKVIFDNLGTANLPSNGKVFIIAHLAEYDTTGVATASKFICNARVFFKDS